MSCRPELVTGYVDGALDAQTTAEIEAHLGSCETCRTQAGFERELRHRLTELPPPSLPLDLEREVRRRLEHPRTPILRWALPLAASLAALLLWGRGLPAFVAWELARDHDHCFNAVRVPAEVWSPDAERIARWFESRGTMVPPLPSGTDGLELVGGRYCPLLDRFAAHVYYEGGRRQLSVFVVSGPARFEETWAGRSRGHSIRLLRSSGRTVAIVATREEDVEAVAATFTTSLAWSTPRRALVPPVS